MVNLKRGGLGEELGVQLIQKEHKNVSENARLSCQPHPLHFEADHQTCGHRPHQETNKFSLISVSVIILSTLRLSERDGKPTDRRCPKRIQGRRK